MNMYKCSAVLVAALACASGNAQTNDARANVPFNFRVGDRAMPAGEYVIRDQPGVLALREVNGKANALNLTANSASRRTAPTHPALTFTRYGEDYCLTSVWAANSRDGRALLQTKQEKALARHFRTVETADIALERASYR